MMAPGRRGRIVRRSITIALAVALSLAMEIAGFHATPVADRPEIAYATLHAIVPLAFAICAGLAWVISESRWPARLMVAFVVLWIPQSIYAVIGSLGWLWPLVRGVDLVWAVVTGIIVLVYPSGRLRERFDRWVAGIAIVATAVNLLAVVLLAAPGPGTCDCAPNPYRVADLPGLFAAIDVGYRIVGVALALAIAVRLLARWVRGSVPARTAAFLMPIALVAWATTLTAQAVSYAVDATGDTVLAVVSLISIASIPVSFVAGVSHARNMRARVADLMRITREGADRGLWAESLARTLRDPSVRVYWWDDERAAYLDASGAAIAVEDADPRGSQSVLPVASPLGAPIALIRHDRVLTDNMRLLDGVSSALRLSVDNGRLRSEIERTLAQVRESRQRIVEAGVEARRRIEHDLHDGAQQQLVSLAMRLRRTADQARDRGVPALGDEIDAEIVQLNGALRELRELAHGIHPSLLSQGGLSLALPEVAGRCHVPTEVEVRVPGRLAELVESTAYFAVAELLANVDKHSGATRAWVQAGLGDDADEAHTGAHGGAPGGVRDGTPAAAPGVLELVVRDNGAGGASLDGGTGIVGIVDRVEAIGGTLELESAPGRGTTATVRLPVRGEG